MKYYQVLNDLIELQYTHELDAYNYKEVGDNLVLIAEEAVLVDTLTKTINELSAKLEVLKREKLKAPFKLKLVIDQDNYKEYFWSNHNTTYKVVVDDKVSFYENVNCFEDKYNYINYYDIKEVTNKSILENLMGYFKSKVNSSSCLFEEQVLCYNRNIREIENILFKLEYKEIRA